MSGCTFRNLESAVADAGGLAAVLTDCVFEGNVRNYSLPHTAWGLTCIDCTLGKTQQLDILNTWKQPGGNATHHPSFLCRRHIVVEVTDANGTAITNARVITFLVNKSLLPQARANMLRGWVHSGFNVHRSRRVLPEEREDLERLA